MNATAVIISRVGVLNYILLSGDLTGKYLKTDPMRGILPHTPPPHRPRNGSIIRLPVKRRKY